MLAEPFRCSVFLEKIDDDHVAFILEHIERHVRGVWRLFKLMVSRMSDSNAQCDSILDRLVSIESKVDDNRRIMSEIKHAILYSKFDSPLTGGRSPSCISLVSSEDQFF